MIRVSPPEEDRELPGPQASIRVTRDRCRNRYKAVHPPKAPAPTTATCGFECMLVVTKCFLFGYVSIASRAQVWLAGRSSVCSQKGTDYCLVLGTPSPFGLQNLENKRSLLRLCARSLSLQELRAKSREHRSYAGGDVLRDKGRHSRSSGLQVAAVAWVRLSKNEYYLVDNVRSTSLSGF